MTEEQKKIIDLINKGFTCNQIAQSLNITNKQLYSRLLTLKNKGIDFERKYYSDGNIVYVPITSISKMIDAEKNKNSSIITRPGDQEIKIMIISDIHLGNELQRLDLLDKVYNYCVKNSISLIFNCGDLIDGTFTKGTQKITDVYEQIDYLIKKYPFDQNILNFAVGGDHDLSALRSCGQNLLTILNNYRHDIIMPLYTNGFVNIKNSQIILNHHTENGKSCNIYNHQTINLIGHTHNEFQAYFYRRGLLNILVPSLSDINRSIPSAIEMNLTYTSGSISYIILKQICFDGRQEKIICKIPYEVFSDSHMDVSFEEDFDFSLDKRLDTKSDEKSKKIEIIESSHIEKKDEEPGEPKIKRLSQIEKFNKRYGF